MANIPLVKPDDAEGQVQEIYDAIEQNFGQVLNLIQVMGNSPPALKGFATMIGSMDEFELDPALRELAYLKASEVNGCKY